MTNSRPALESRFSRIKQRIIALTRNRKKALLIAAGAAVFITGFLLYLFKTDIKRAQRETIYVHYIGRYNDTSGKYSNPLKRGHDYTDTGSIADERNYAMFHEIALAKYLKNLEDRYNKNFELVIHDNFCDPATSAKIYRDIALQMKNNNILVIDNSWGRELKKCSAIIKKYSIPVISLNADHNNLDYGNNAIFMGNAENAPAILTQFIKKILKTPKVCFITEEEYPLTNVYEAEFAKKGIIVSDRIYVKMNNPNAEQQEKFKKQFIEIAKHHKNGLIVLNSHHKWGEYIIKFIKEHKEINNLRFVFPGYSASNLSKDLTDMRNNEFIIMAPGQDAISKNIVDDVDMFRSTKDAKLFNRINIHEFIYRCIVANDILETYLKKNETYDNRKFSKYIKTLPEKHIQTANNEHYFNQKDNLIEYRYETIFSNFKKGTLSSYNRQIDNRDSIISNLFFGMEVENINNIDVVAGKYGITFYYWVKIDSANSNIDIGFPDLHEESKVLLVNRRVESSRSVYRLYKVTGSCNQKYYLEKYPFDEQVLHLNAEIIDPNAQVSVSFDEEMLLGNTNFLDDTNFDDWTIKSKDYKVTVDNKIQEYSKGIFTSGINKYKSLSFWITAKRNPTNAILSVIVPIFIIGFISIIMLFLRDRSFNNIGEASAGLLVSTVLYSISLNELTPSTGVLKKTDWIFWITLIFVMLNFVFTALYSSTLFRSEREPVITRQLAKVFIVIYPAMVLYIIFFF